MQTGLSREYHTCDTSVGYPPGLTRERFISFARNTINRGIRKNTIHANTLFTQKHYLPQKHYSRKIRKNWFLEMRKIWFTKFHEYTIHERIRERESVLTVRYDQFWDSEIGKLSLTPTLLFIDFGNHQNDQNTPQNRPWIVHGRKWPFCPQAQNSIFVFWAFI